MYERHEATLRCTLARMLEARHTALDCYAGMHKPDVNTNSGTEYTPLYAACVSDKMDAVRWLVEQLHADINRPGTPFGTPIFSSVCRRGFLDVAQYLYARGNDPLRPPNHGPTPFCEAYIFGRIDIVRWLARIGAFDPRVLPLSSGTQGWRTHVWITEFQTARTLIAHWSDGRSRDARARGHAKKYTVWTRLPRQAMAEVLILISPS